MFVVLKFDVPISEWEYIPQGTKLDVVMFDEFTGFTGIEYKNKKFFLHNDYFINVPELIKQ